MVKCDFSEFNDFRSTGYSSTGSCSVTHVKTRNCTGNSKNMPFQVKDALITVSRDHGKLSQTESEKYVELLVRNRLYQTETW